ncbi:MAG: DUF167 domain-containing protein [Rubripirellula sp.]|nr:DUF167 domain-containing protein [Rubripirellula sp.]
MIKDRTRISVHATPGVRRTHVGGTHDGALRIRVTAAADKGRANKVIIEALADALGIRKSQIALISGETNRRKLFEVGIASNKLDPVLHRLLRES